jgi:hypothetical protein
MRRAPLVLLLLLLLAGFGLRAWQLGAADLSEDEELSTSLPLLGYGELFTSIAGRPPLAFLWTPATGMRDAGFGSNSQALAISVRGRMAGLRVIDAGVLGLTRRLRTSVQVLPDVAADEPPFSGPAGINACGDLVGSSSSPDPTNGNPVPALWLKERCD